MIKITKATYLRDYVISLQFSDGTEGEYDLHALLDHDTELTRRLKDPIEFRRFFIDFGALCWPNGLELSPGSMHQKLRDAGRLRRLQVA